MFLNQISFLIIKGLPGSILEVLKRLDRHISCDRTFLTAKMRLELLVPSFAVLVSGIIPPSKDPQYAPPPRFQVAPSSTVLKCVPRQAISRPSKIALQYTTFSIGLLRACINRVGLSRLSNTPPKGAPKPYAHRILPFLT